MPRETTRTPRFVLTLAATLAALTIFTLPTGAAAATAADGATHGEAIAIARAYLETHHEALGLAAGDLADVVIGDAYVSRHTGTTHVYLRQRFDGIEVRNAILNLAVADNGTVAHAGNRFVADLARKIDDAEASLTAIEAVERAASELGLAAPENLSVLEQSGRRDRRARLSDGGISRADIPAQLVYQPLPNGRLRLAWDLGIGQLDQQHWWSVRIDAESGELLDTHDLVADESYEVYAIPVESPHHTMPLPPADGRTVEFDPYLDAAASPFGWHDTDGVAGPEFTITRGNNVHAYADTDNDDGPDGDPNAEPDAGPDLDFVGALVPIDLTLDPDLYTQGSIANLFYWNNIVHDVTWNYGFDEASGNFQVDNYGNGGLGGDDVRAQAQDGGGNCNANFFTPADGSRPRMQMYLCSSPFAQLVTVNSPPEIAGSYVANPSNNGGTGDGLTADLAIVDDGVEPTDDACEPVINDLTGKIALIVWNEGACNSSVFVANAAAAGAVAAIIVDNTEEPLTNFGGSAAIPSVAVGQSDGNLFIATIEGGDTVNSTLEDNPGAVSRDGSLDNGVVIHEYGHGISNRLTGGPGDAGCLGNTEQMGEGWSDYLALMFTMEAGDVGTDSRGTGTWMTHEGPDGPGLRPAPYSTDFGVNPFTYAGISGVAVPHGVGFVWATMAWEMTWDLIAEYGMNPEFYDDWTTGGNNLAMQLVMDGMKLQPCSPGFVDGRDAILAADDLLTGDGSFFSGVNQCTIWTAFARRGLGWSADQEDTDSVTDGAEAFDLPPACESIGDLSGPQNICQGQTATWQIGVGGVFTAPPVTLSAAGEPAGTTTSFNPPAVDPVPGTSEFELSDTASAAAGNYPITVTGTDTAATTFDTAVELNVFDAVPAAGPDLVAPADGAVDEPIRPTFEWMAAADALSYTLEVSDDPGFGSIVYSASGLTGLAHVSSINLDYLTTYYWRVRANNPCGDGAYSAVWSFTTPFLIGDCPSDVAREIHFEDDLESGASGWTSEGVGDTWMLSDARVTSGENAFYAVDPETLSDQRLVSPPVTLPTGALPLTLHFQNYQIFETPNDDGRCWDAGILEITTDAGASWSQVPGSAMLTDPYDNIIWNDTAGNNPITDDYGATEAWCAELEPFTLSVVDLRDWAGETVQFRWRLGSDSAAGNEGWYIDDVKVQSCVETPLFADGFESGNISAWSNAVP